MTDTPIYRQICEERTPLGQVLQDPLRERDIRALEELWRMEESK